MLGRWVKGVAWATIAAGAWVVFVTSQAQAVPSLARQVGMSCNACHTVYPELTPFGRKFKLTGYTASKKTDKKYEWPPPVAAMAQFAFTHQEKSQPTNVLAPYVKANDNWDGPQAISVFWAGRIYGPIGIFSQGTYDGIGRTFFLDNTDLRAAHTMQLCGKELIVGATFNNNPTVQDVLNTTPAWGYPWAGSGTALGPAPATLIEGGLAALVAGGGLYAYYNNFLYLEASVYGNSTRGPLVWTGMGTPPDVQAKGVIPYWRAFLYHQWGKQNLAVGTFGMIADVFPGGETRGTSDQFVDLGWDAQYQFVGTKNIFTARSTFIYERQNWYGTFPLAGSQNRWDRLYSYKFNMSYFRRFDYGTIGGTAGYFLATGRTDNGLYAPDPGDGSRGKPYSDGFVFEVNYLPWGPYERAKFALQYTVYNRFNGARTNYDAFGRNAADNNTLYLLFWLAI